MNSLPVICLVLLSVTCALSGCVVGRDGPRYEAETVTVSVGTGTILPGGNVVTTYRRVSPPEPIPTEEGEIGG